MSRGALTGNRDDGTSSMSRFRNWEREGILDRTLSRKLMWERERERESMMDSWENEDNRRARRMLTPGSIMDVRWPA
jgi:hypothetical protein